MQNLTDFEIFTGNDEELKKKITTFLRTGVIIHFVSSHSSGKVDKHENLISTIIFLYTRIEVGTVHNF